VKQQYTPQASREKVEAVVTCKGVKKREKSTRRLDAGQHACSNSLRLLPPGRQSCGVFSVEEVGAKVLPHQTTKEQPANVR